MYIELKLTYMGLKLSHIGLKLSYMGLKLTHVGLKLTYIELILTYMGLNLDYMGLKLTQETLKNQNKRWAHFLSSEKWKLNNQIIGKAMVQISSSNPKVMYFVAIRIFLTRHFPKIP